MKQLYCFLLFIGLATIPATALTPEEAIQAYDRGDYAEAAPTLKTLADKSPKNASANAMAGVALFKTGDIAEAKLYLSRGTNESKLILAEIAVDEYAFSEAESILDEYIEAQKKAKKDVSPEANRLMDKVRKMSPMLDRVEKIVVFDSIVVPKATFFEAYNLSPAAGSVQSAALLPKKFKAVKGSAYFASENNSTVIWSTNTDNSQQLAQSWMLADGSWDEAQPLGIDLNDGGAAAYPFLMNDGVTLYFANNGDNSIGGYDIFISRFDGEKFLQPQNLGMPYNSPYDDYMLAIDEETGIGWWATDRNRLGDSITIYKFIPQELRKNYPVNTANLAGLAKLTNYKRTWERGKNYSKLIKTSEKPTEWEESLTVTQYIAMPDGRKLPIGQLKSKQARTLVKQYSALLAKLDSKETALAEMRKKYSRGEKSLMSSISKAEVEVNSLRNEIIALRNKIVKTQKPNP